MTDERTRELLLRALATQDGLDVMAWRHAEGLEPFIVGDVVKAGTPDASGWYPTGRVVTIEPRPRERVGPLLGIARGIGIGVSTWLPVDGASLVTPARCDECAGEAWLKCECSGTGWTWPPKLGACRECRECGGSGVVDSGGTDPNGNALDMPCTACFPCATCRGSGLVEATKGRPEDGTMPCRCTGLGEDPYDP